MLITKPKALALLEQIVNEYGADHISDRCTYTLWDSNKFEYTRTPNCIVGQVLAKVDPAIIDRIVEDKEQSRGADNVLTDKAYVGDVRFSAPAVKVLNVAQILQDGRGWDGEFGGSSDNMPWGQVLENVKKL